MNVKFHLTRDNLIALGIALALILVATLAVFVPQNERLREVRTDIATRKAELESQSRLVEVLPDMLARIQEMKSRYQDFDRRLPKQKELGGFLREISGTLSDRELDNQMIEPGSPTREELFHTLPITMRFEGSFLALADFLERVDNMERLSRVQRLNVGVDPKNDDLKIELQMNIYFTES